MLNLDDLIKNAKNIKTQEEQDKWMIDWDNAQAMNNIRSFGFSGISNVPDKLKMPKSIQDKVNKICDNMESFIKNHKSLILAGTVGSGKTVAAAIIALEYQKTTGLTPLCVKAVDLIGVNSWDYPSDDYKDAKFLVIDDLGSERYNTKVNDVFIELLIYRIEHNLTTIITSNSTSSLNIIFENQRLSDRMASNYIYLETTEESQRGQ